MNREPTTANQSRRMPAWLWTLLGRTLVRWFFKYLYRITLIREAPIPQSCPLIIVANHQSHYDPPMVGVLVPERPSSPLARASLFRVPFVGRLITYLWSIPLHQDRSDPAAMRTALQRLKEGGTVLIFPEGSRTTDGAVHEFLRGSLLLIKRAKAPVLPVAIEGAYDVWPPHNPVPKFTGLIALKSGKAIPYDELMQHGPDEALDRLRREVERLRLELREELHKRTGGRYPAPNAGDVPYWEREVASHTCTL